MKECKDFEKLILEGQTSPELDAHLRSCPGCTQLRKQVELFRLPKAETEVPASLDNAIRAAAREKLTVKQGIPFPSHLVKIFLSAAACLLICCGIAFFSFSHRDGTQKQEVAAAADNKTTSEFWSGNWESDVIDLAFDMDAGNEMQLIALSDQNKSIFSEYNAY